MPATVPVIDLAHGYAEGTATPPDLKESFSLAAYGVNLTLRTTRPR